MLLRKLFTLSFICIVCASCALFHEDMKIVNEALAKKDFSSAIIELDDMKSSYAKKLNSKVHVDFALTILKDLTQEANLRYLTAKDLLEKAVSLDPKNKDARVYYLMVLKLKKND